MFSDPPAFFIGVDGGGSRTRVRVVDAVGRLRGSAEGGAANVYLAPETALESIESTLKRAIDAAGLGDHERMRASVGLGLAGVSSPAIGTRVATYFDGRFARVSVRNDAVIACLGAHAGRDGGLVIAGTGSAAVVRLGAETVNIGGRGFLLGDDGSGAVLGRQAWRRALRAHDGLEELTPLLRAFMAEFDGDPVAVIAWGRHATSSQFGAYAPRILEAARGGDVAAQALVAETGRALGDLVEAVLARGATRVSLVGGLAAPMLPFLAESTRSRLAPPLHDALDGALFLAGAPSPRERGAS